MDSFNGFGCNNKPESYYRDLMSGKVKEEAKEYNPALDTCAAECGKGYSNCYDRSKSSKDIQGCNNNKNQCIESCRAKYKK